MLPTFEVAHIVRQYGGSFIASKQPLGYQKKVLNAIDICRTAQLGGHVDACDKCTHVRISYNSCRNRHCPKCQSTEREKWIIARKEDLLPVSYYHVVFTIPQQLNQHCLEHPKAMYNILFDTAKETLFAFAADKKYLGASMGFIALLHTWGQNLSLHPHLHCIVPGGGIATNGQWKATRSKGDFLFPIKQMSTVFKNKFMHKYRQWLQQSNIHITNKLRQLLYQKKWVIYLKQPFGGPEQVVEYLGRYSHKIAISNHRLKSIADNKIVFSYKDYKDGSKTKLMTLESEEFLRRFCMHILPSRFMKIRHYGFLSNRGKQKLKIHLMTKGKIPTAPIKLNYKQVCKQLLNFDVDECPVCKKGQMIRLFNFSANAPPSMETIKEIKRQIVHN
jgi:hypothetical protein